MRFIRGLASLVVGSEVTSRVRGCRRGRIKVNQKLKGETGSQSFFLEAHTLRLTLTWFFGYCVPTLFDNVRQGATNIVMLNAFDRWRKDHRQDEEAEHFLRTVIAPEYSDVDSVASVAFEGVDDTVGALARCEQNLLFNNLVEKAHIKSYFGSALENCRGSNEDGTVESAVKAVGGVSFDVDYMSPWDTKPVGPNADELYEAARQVMEAAHLLSRAAQILAAKLEEQSHRHG